MPVRFSCPCGQQLEVEDQHAGMQVSCPTCGGVTTAPARPRRVVATPLAPPPEPPPETGYAVVEEAPARRSSRRRRDDDDEDDEDRPRRRRRDDDEDPEDRRDRLRYLPPPRPPTYEQKLLNGSMIGGAVAMGVAVIWFVAGLAVGFIFFYPPVLFVLGMIAFIRGVIQRRE